MKIVLIHGANASEISWNWVKSNVDHHMCINWDMMTNTEQNLANMESQLPDQCMVVGHSMGGLYAWHLAQRNPHKVTAGISVATPWGGSIQAGFWKMFNFNIPWLQMLSRMEPWTSQPRLIEPACKWTNVVTTHGFDLLGIGKNDGVVTVASQRELMGPATEIVLDHGHNEVLQSPQLVSIIQSHLA